jgi:hypothetical protein
MDEPHVLTREDLLAVAAATPAAEPAVAAAADRDAIAATTIPSTIGWFNRFARWANERRRQLVRASRRAVDALYRRLRRVRTLEERLSVTVETCEPSPLMTVMLADTLARHAPPARDLTRSIREAAAA